MRKSHSVFCLFCLLAVVGHFVLWESSSALADDETPAASIDIADIYRRVIPAIVSIEVDIGWIDEAGGTGFVIDGKGHIVTNAHVVEDARHIRVIFHDELETQAELIGIDRLADIAVIKVDVETDNLLPVSFGDSDDLAVGQSVLAIGNPHGLVGSLTTGIISGLNHDLAFDDGSIKEGLIQTDAALAPGSSGGPLINQAGEVIGINTGGYGGDDIGFSIPVETALRIANELIEIRSGLGRIGITAIDLDPQWRQEKCLPEDFRGVLVTQVESGGPAELAGLRESVEFIDEEGNEVEEDFVYHNEYYDIVTAVDDVPVQSRKALINYLQQHTSPREAVKLSIVRSIETVNEIIVPIKLDYDNSFIKTIANDSLVYASSRFYGLYVVSAQFLGIDSGILVLDVDENSTAAVAGLRSFSRIYGRESDRLWCATPEFFVGKISADIIFTVGSKQVYDMEDLLTAFAMEPIRPWDEFIDDEAVREIRNLESEGKFYYIMLENRHGEDVTISVVRWIKSREEVNIPLILR